MASHEELVSQFTDVTGVEPERAQFYLESSAWQLEVAIASFYESDELSGVLNNLVEQSVEEEEAKEVAQKVLQSSKSEDMDSKASKPKPPPKRFATLNDIQHNDSSSDEEEGQAFYAGGSKYSGQQVLGPDKKKDIASDMFKSCKNQSIALEQKPGGHQRPNTFGGTAYKLGQTNSDTEVVSATSSDDQANPAIITLKLWKDGFTINDSDLREYTDPDSREFLAAIKRGEIPEEIRRDVQGTEVRLNMEYHRHETYVPQKAKVKAFTGKGHMLGSPSPATVGMTVPTDPADQAANEAQARKELNLDDSKPTTTLQIRLADGSSVKAQFNVTHTVSDVRRYITTMRPQYAIREFSLLTMYPAKELPEDKSIEEAGLQNTAIMQRLK